jgi:hypothetical protein
MDSATSDSMRRFTWQTRVKNISSTSPRFEFAIAGILAGGYVSAGFRLGGSMVAPFIQRRE